MIRISGSREQDDYDHNPERGVKRTSNSARSAVSCAPLGGSTSASGRTAPAEDDPSPDGPRVFEI